MIFLKLSLLTLLIAASGMVISAENVITCYGDVQRLQCESGLLKIQKANYGRTDSITCTTGRPYNQISNINCYANQALDKVNARCEGKTKCTVPAMNNVFSDPCYGTYKYLHVLYSCIPQATKTSETCEGNNAVLKCESGLLKIQKANYGRTDSITCTAGRPYNQIYNTNCYANQVLDKVKTRCEGKTKCTVPATNNVFSDPCYGTYKYLRVLYSCIPQAAKTSETCEGSNAVLKCESGLLKIQKANYGRTDSITCTAGRPYNQIYNTNCYANQALDKVKTRCEGKTKCTVPATNNVFSDPCYGTYKYLRIKYSCGI